MRISSGIRHISFDLWLTIFKSHNEFKSLRSELIADHFSVKAPKAYILEVVTEYDKLFNSINETIGHNLDTYEIVMIILYRLGVDIQGVSLECLENFYQRMENLFVEFHPVLIDPNTVKVLSNLKAEGISLNILSNTAFIKGRTVNKVLQKLEIDSFFDFCIYSDEIGYSKPSSLAFKSLLTSIEAIKPINKAQVLHVGDNIIADYEGAINFGFKAQLLNVNGITLSDLFL